LVRVRGIELRCVNVLVRLGGIKPTGVNALAGQLKEMGHGA
jgi:hypothetical protein